MGALSSAGQNKNLVMKEILVTVLLAYSCSGSSGLSESLAQRPNVVVLISDDQGWADIGYNNPRVYTPNLDRLANEGAMLKSHYVMSQCTPTRVALMTGRYPGRFGRRALTANNKQVIPHDTPTMALMFDRMGYQTLITGKWHLGSLAEHGPNHYGFDESYGSLTGAVGMYEHRYQDTKPTIYDPTWHRNHEVIPGAENGKHVTDLCGDAAVEFIKRKRKKGEEPFFLYVPFHAPHTPLDERGQLVDVPTQPDPENPKRWLNEDQIKWFNDPAGKIQREPERDKRLLLATVYHLDSAVGDIVKALEETGQRENTMIFFSADNGPWINSRGGGYPHHIPLKNYNQPSKLRGKKLDVYEGGIHVAGFVNWPGKIAPKKVEEAVHIIDWFPTLAALTDYTPERTIPWDGVDLSDLLFQKEGTLDERDLYWIWHPKTDRWALRFGDWKIIKYSKEEPKEPADWALYHLGNDPSEKNDVAAQHPKIVEQLHERFVKQRSRDFKGDLIESAIE